MKFTIEQWTIDQLIAAHAAGNLDLAPPYQRNFIWSLDDQRILIDSISKNYPIPNIFLKLTEEDKYEVVDGQQRTRTIIAFRNGDFSDFDNRNYNTGDFPEFNDFKIAIIIITEILATDISIEEFYGLVNSAGEHLNRPEIKKAKYYDTNFLKLINICNDHTNFRELGLFSDAVLKRMNDMDFVSELIILLKDGITDKKERIDRTFEDDISIEQSNVLQSEFFAITEILLELNHIYLLKKTRYKQRNDFYTLFGFINDNELTDPYLKYVYKVLVLIALDISPSNDDCIPFQNYARNCVTQSNSRNARLERLYFFEKLFLNQSPNPNAEQIAILEYYSMPTDAICQNGDYYTIDADILHILKPSIIFAG